MAAAEVLQIYLEPPGQAVQRPARALVGFARVPLAAGACQRITLTIPLHRLAFLTSTRMASRSKRASTG
jgi:beta-glucosidase